MTPAELVQVIQDEGYRAKLETDADGDVSIETKIRYGTVIWLFFGEDKLSIRSLSFRAAFADHASLQSVNAWNAKKRYVSVYLNEDGKQRFQMDTFVVGATRELIVANLNVWDSLMGDVGEVT